MFKGLINQITGNGLASRLDAQARRYVELKRFNGSVLAAQGDDILLNKGYGYANVEHNIPNTPATVFRIGSISKALTSLPVMMLIENGHISLDDRINTFLTGWIKDDTITIHHLLSNTSGIPDYIQMPEYQQIGLRHNAYADVIALFKDLPLDFEPGERFGYSNSNWVLLSAILDVVTGKPYEHVMREWIFEPAGMMHSGYTWVQPVIAHRAAGYIDNGETLFHAENLDETSMSGAGGIYSTVEDMYRLDRALASGKLLPLRAFERLASPITGTQGAGYGYGWELSTAHGTPTIGHSSGLPGFSGMYLRLPKVDGVVIALGNFGSAAANQLAADLAGLLLGAPVELPRSRAFIQIDPALLEDYAGEYSSTFFGRTYILRFIMDVQGLPRTYLNAYSETEFYVRSKGDVDLKFIRDETGKVNGIDMNWAGAAGFAPRL